MHRALQIVEVVDMICAQLNTGGLTFLLPKNTTGNLARLARTSSIFLGPALNLLWRNQGNIINLLRCMPSDIWDISENRDADDEPAVVTIVLRRAVVFADWERFRFYCHRVKSFSFDQEHSLQSPDVYETLSLCFPDQYIFPNLQKLEWFSLGDSEAFGYIRLFISPGITDLHLTIDTVSKLSILPMFASACASLKNVVIGSPLLPAVKPVPALSNFVCTLRHLETLIVADLTPEAMSHIAELPYLRYLWLMSSAPVPSFQPPKRSPPFPALKVLEYESMEHAPAFLALLLKCPLAQLTIFSRGTNAPTAEITARRFYSALATHCLPSSLERIAITPGHWTIPIPEHERSMYLVSGDILRPLFFFSNLVDVALTHPVGIDLDNVVGREMARAWPRIERLQLRPQHLHRITPRITLEGIYAFAQYCPRLQLLCIAFDATLIPMIENNPSSQRNLVQLVVAYSPISEPHRVAHFLSVIFPHLDYIGTAYTEHHLGWRGPEVAASHQLWKEVETALDGR
ncbi:hypothetical protein B0H11DRAFT_751625 [Mycena galericulata]|nr:hypothetical protein B0H11DRAFT_751625 [Mycena galericulata]